MSEFAKKYGTFKSGLKHASNYALSAIIVPVALAFALSYIINNYGVLTEFSDYIPDIGSIVLIGGCLTVTAFFTGYYDKGSYSRAIIGILLAAFLFLFLWQISAIIKVMFDITNFLVDVDFSFFVFLLAIFCLMKISYSVGELIYYRRRWNKKKHLIDSSQHTQKNL